MIKNISKGFTLVEVMIVFALIAVLAAIVIISLQSQISKGHDATRKSDLDRIKIAVEEYEKDHNCYPSPSLMTCLNGGTGLQPYLNQIPCDPVSKASYYYEYEDSTCSRWWRLFSNLDNSSDMNILPLCGGPNNDTFNYYVSSPNAPGCGLPAGPTGAGGGGGGGGGPTPVPTQGGRTYYGCKTGSCVQIMWDPARPGPECDPNYLNSSCYSQCGLPRNECKEWK